MALASLLISLSVFAGAPYISQWPNGNSPGPNQFTNPANTYIGTGILWPTINTNQFVITGLTNGVPPSVNVAYLNGTVWTWNGHAYLNGTNGIYAEPNYAGLQPAWIATNASWHDISANPHILFIIGGAFGLQVPIFPANGQSSLVNGDIYAFGDGTINALPISGSGRFLTNAFAPAGNTYPPAFNVQPGISNTLAWITPEMPPYNAQGDGVTLDYQAVQQAINDCATYSANGPYPVALFLPHQYYMGTNSLNLTPGPISNGGVRIYGNNAALMGVPNLGYNSSAFNGTLVWAAGTQHAGMLCTNSVGVPNNTGSVLQGLNLVGPTQLVGNAPYGGLVAMDLSTPGAAQFKVVDCQFTHWDTVFLATNAYDLTMYNVSCNSCTNFGIISGAQNLNLHTINAYPRGFGFLVTDNSVGVIDALDFSMPDNLHYAVIVKNSGVDLINANFDAGGCVYNDNGSVHAISFRQGGVTSSVRWVSTNCGNYQFDLNGVVLPDPNNIFVSSFNCSQTNILRCMTTPLNPIWVTNGSLVVKTQAYYYPGFR